MCVSMIFLPIGWPPSRHTSGESLGENTMLQETDRSLFPIGAACEVVHNAIAEGGVTEAG